MNDAYAFQCAMLGDILFRETSEVTFAITVTGPTTYTYTTSLLAGSWFADALTFWQWLVSQWNGTMSPTGVSSATIELDPDDADYGKISVYADPQFGTVISVDVTIDDTTVYPALGMAASVLSASDSFTTDIPITHFLVPVWPPLAYERGVANLSGSSCKAHDGTIYSTVGSWQENVSLGIALDRRSQDFDELNEFIKIWRERWCRGRSVTFYLDRSNIPTEYTGTVEEADVLVLPSNQSRIDLNRLIPFKEFQDTMSSVEFAVRTPLPATEIGQASFILEE